MRCYALSSDVVVDKYNETYMGEDDKPYLTLGYGNGPGWQLHRSETLNYANGTVRKDLTGVETTGELSGRVTHHSWSHDWLVHFSPLICTKVI